MTNEKESNRRDAQEAKMEQGSPTTRHSDNELSNRNDCPSATNPSRHAAHPEGQKTEKSALNPPNIDPVQRDSAKAASTLLAGTSSLLAAACQSPSGEDLLDDSDKSSDSSSDGSVSESDDPDASKETPSSTGDDDDDDDDDDSESSSDDDSDGMFLEVNGQKYKVDADPNRTLLDILRHELRLTGTKYGCGEGQCGACTVRMNGTAIRSCLLPLQNCWGKKFQTIEGLEESGQLHPVQQAFIDEGAMQCGYCTAGMIMSAVSVLDANPSPSDAQIVAGMTGNICRCGTYPRIVKAIKRASRGMKGE